MQNSAEIRWFHDGPLGEKTLDWFKGAKNLVAETRTDRYFAFPGCESGGVKLRTYNDKRNFEIKLQRGGPEPLKLPAGLSGRADCWVKWSCGEDSVHALVGELMAANKGFIDVEKTRYLRKFSADAGQRIEVDGNARPAAGCGVELTALSVHGKPWWSFALEAFGPDEHIRQILLETARDFIAQNPPIDTFTVANSCSYPVWLGGQIIDV